MGYGCRMVAIDGDYGEGSIDMSRSTAQPTQSNHDRLLGQPEVSRLKRLAVGLDLSCEVAQRELVRRIEMSPGLVPGRASATDVAIEFLITTEELRITDICSGLRMDQRTNPARRTHLAIEAHKRFQQSSVREGAVA